MKSLQGLPEQFVCFDTEYTTWEGALARNWSGSNEHREIIQIGAVLVGAQGLVEVDRFMCYVRPVINPKLSLYCIQLTGITQKNIDEEGLGPHAAFDEFNRWSQGFHLYCWGYDLQVMKENAELIHIPFPFRDDQGIDVRQVFKDHGTPTDGFNSSTIPNAFGKTPPSRPHDALNDALSIVEGLRALEESLA